MSKDSKPDKALGRVVRHLRENGVKHVVDSGRNAVLCTMPSPGGVLCNVIAQVEPRRSLFQVRIEYPTRVPRGRRHAVAEAAHRATYGMWLGGFDFDMRDGELRFRAVTCYQGDGPTDEIVRECLTCSLAMYSRYFGAFMKVIYGEMPPTEAIAEVEEGPASEPSGPRRRRPGSGPSRREDGEPKPSPTPDAGEIADDPPGDLEDDSLDDLEDDSLDDDDASSPPDMDDIMKRLRGETPAEGDDLEDDPDDDEGDGPSPDPAGEAPSPAGKGDDDTPPEDHDPFGEVPF